MIFKNPLVFIILPLFFIAFFVLRRIFPERSFPFPSGEVIRLFRGSFKVWLGCRLIYLRASTLALLIIALARPQVSEESVVRKEGIAIVLAIDCSSTMLAEDLQLGPLGLARLVPEEGSSKRRLNRMDAVREVAKDFVDSRPDDMIGIVAFAAQAYVVCPPTLDREWLTSALGRVKVGLIKDGTAIGSGILSSLDSLKGVTARSKVIILLTDGINNYGEVPPLVAAKAARSLGVKIYTVGIASSSPVPFPAKDAAGRNIYENVRIDIDEGALRKIADATGGNFYRAGDMKSLKGSHADIDKLEKVELEETPYEEYKDVFPAFLMCALAFLVLDIVLGNTYLRRIP